MDRTSKHGKTIRMTYADIQELAATHGLDILGGFQITDKDKAPDAKTLLMLGPSAEFWNIVTGSAEFQDADPDPIDRWSKRVIEALAQTLNAKALFPFGEAPYLPFYSWALRTEHVWGSPVKLAVHDTHGLFVSFRGALALAEAVELPSPPSKAPCETCTQPCLTACPVNALNEQGYDVETCRSFLRTSDGQDCMSGGCKVRRACPVGQDLRMPEQSAYHMASFHNS